MMPAVTTSAANRPGAGISAAAPGTQIKRDDVQYWVAMSIASICGANAGDVLVDDLQVDWWVGLAAASLLFAALAWAERRRASWPVARYWLSVLTVRVAATTVADLLRGSIHGPDQALLMVGLALGTAIFGRCLDQRRSVGYAARRSAAYWAAMLSAGTLGTILADTAAHAVPPVTVGVPVAAGLTSLALALLYVGRRRAAPQSAAVYWLTIVAIRAWGTNVGDILAYLLTRPVSMLSSGLLLVTWLNLTRSKPCRVA